VQPHAGGCKAVGRRTWQKKGMGDQPLGMTPGAESLGCQPCGWGGVDGCEMYGDVRLSTAPLLCPLLALPVSTPPPPAPLAAGGGPTLMSLWMPPLAWT
jgi:hypothetical protein